MTIYGSNTTTSSITVQPTVASIVPSYLIDNLSGSFAGVGIDAVSNRWILDDGNRLIYPNSILRQQPATGPESIIGIQAVMQRSDLNGALGFAIYTDSSVQGDTFDNGYLCLFGPDALSHIYLIKNTVWTEITSASAQSRYPLDLQEHSYAVVVLNASASQMEFALYVDGLVYAQAQTNVLFANGTIGFSLIQGAGEVLVGPGSFSFNIGLTVTESLPLAMQEAITAAEMVINVSTGTLYPNVVTIPNLIGYETSQNVFNYQWSPQFVSPGKLIAGAGSDLWGLSNSNASILQVGRFVPASYTSNAYTVPIIEYDVGFGGVNPISDICLGPDGNIWYNSNQSFYGSFIGSIAASGTVTSVSVLDTDTVQNSICSGSDGNIWFSSTDNQLVTYFLSGTAAGTFQTCNLKQTLSIATSGSDGNIWFIIFAGSCIGVATSAGDFSSYYNIPGGPAATAGYAQTYNGICSGPDNNLWFTDYWGSAIIKMTLSSKTFTTYPTITGAPGNGTLHSSEPWGICVGPDGNLWFTESGLGFIGPGYYSHVAKISTGGSITEYASLSNGTPEAICAGPDGLLWFLNTNTSPIGKVTTSGTFTYYYPSYFPIGTYNSICPGSDGNLWFTIAADDMVAKVSTGGSFTYYTNSGYYPISMCAGPDSNLWTTTQNGVSACYNKVTTSGSFTDYLVATSSNVLQSIFSGQNGDLWWTDETAISIDYGNTSGISHKYPVLPDLTLPSSRAMISTASNVWFFGLPGDGNMDICSIPTNLAGTLNPISDINQYPIYDTYPGDITPISNIVVGPDGNLWFLAEDTTTNSISLCSWDLTYLYLSNILFYKSGYVGSNWILIKGSDGNLWFNDYSAGYIVQSSLTGQMVKYTLPSGYDNPISIAQGPDGNIWFNQNTLDKIGVLQIVDAGPPNIAYGSTETLGYNISANGLQAGIGNVGEVVAMQWANGTTFGEFPISSGGTNPPNPFTADLQVATLSIVLPAGGTWIIQVAFTHVIYNGSLDIQTSFSPAATTVNYFNWKETTGNFQMGTSYWYGLASGGTSASFLFSTNCTAGCDIVDSGNWEYRAFRLTS